MLIICLLTAILVILLLNIFEHFFVGDRGKRKNLTSYYKQLRPEEKALTAQSKKNNYKTYRYNSIKDYYIYAIPSCTILFLCSMVVLKTLLISIILCLFGLFIPKILYDYRRNKIKDLLTVQFRDALNSITSSLKAGLSLSSSIFQCEEDLGRLQGLKKEQYMLYEFEKLSIDLHTGMSIDDALKEFSNRLRIDDIEDFVNSILVVRQKGGNLVEIVENVSKMITEKLSIREEIKILTAGKKMEARMLTLTPITMITLISILSPNYMQEMLGSALGNLLIILGFILLAANYFIGKRIVDINI